MLFTDVFQPAWLSITRRPLRSFLALFGVAIGVCALISIMSIENCWRRSVAEFFASMDLETILVKMPPVRDWREAGYKKATCDTADLQEMTRQFPAIESATFMIWGMFPIKTDYTSRLMTVRTVDAQFRRTLPSDIKEGRFFSADELDTLGRVCVLTHPASIFLFGDQKALGQRLNIGGHYFKIIGILTDQRHLGIQADSIYIPQSCQRTLLRGVLNEDSNTEIFVRTKASKTVVRQIEDFMRKRAGGDGSREFTTSLWKVREVALHARDRANLYSSLAGICALFASGIGISALLFVSISEEAREIGIRRALGATRLHIYLEYLLNALLLTLGGALLGVLLSIPASAVGAFSSRWQPVLDPFTSAVLSGEHKALPKLTEIALSVSGNAILVAVTMAIITSVVAAFLPASEAAGIDPAKIVNKRPGTHGPVREVLTCVQVALGVFVLILLATRFVTLDLQEKAEARDLLGQDKISVEVDPISAMRRPFSLEDQERYKESFAATFMSESNLNAVRKITPLLTNVTPNIPEAFSVNYAGRVIDNVRVVFCSVEEFNYQPPLSGEAYSRCNQAFKTGKAGTVITAELKADLFGNDDPIGRAITIGAQHFTVLGIRPNPTPGTGLVNHAWVPIQFYKQMEHRRMRERSIGPEMEARIVGRPIDSQRYIQSILQMRKAVLQTIPVDCRNGLEIREQIPENTKQFIFQSKASVIRGATGAIAVILVAIIGLANMLLVTITHDIREIGLLRTFGAQKVDIVLKFLSFGNKLAVIGSIIGLICALIVGHITKSWNGVPTPVIFFWAATEALLVLITSTIIALFCAFYASRIHPIEAIRNE
jgi:putative ABC transport system permease protein